MEIPRQPLEPLINGLDHPGPILGILTQGGQGHYYMFLFPVAMGHGGHKHLQW